MAKKVVISFESDSINVVYGSPKKGNLVVNNTLTFPKEELNSFLKKEKTKEFTVVSNFETFFSDIVSIPPVKGKYFMNILQAEIKKTFSELKEYTFLYTILGKEISEGKKKQEIFVFAVNNSDLYNIINKFTLHGKRVTHLIPSILSLSMTVMDSKEPVLCLTKSGINKYLFLLKEGKIFFIRSAQGIDSGLHDFDVENINMTINHCRQSVKINPSQVILIGSACFEYDAKAGPIAPLVCLDYRPRVLASKETIIKFMPAIVCLDSEKQLKSFFKKSDLLPVKYKLTHMVKTVLSYATVLFLVLFVAGAGYAAMNIIGLLETKKQIEAVRTKLKDLESIKSEYNSKVTERQKLMPLINLINQINSEPDFQKLLIILSNLNLKNIEIQSISMTPAAKVINLTMKGIVKAKGFNKARVDYQNFVEPLKKVKGMNLSSHKLEIQDKTFSVLATYKPE